jgi:Fic family protein
MRQPMPPPSMTELRELVLSSAATKGDAGQILRLYTYAEEDPYRHWDELRYKTPPDGFSVEEWWYAVKIKRASQMRVLPLPDKRGQHFTYCLPDEVLRETDFVTAHLSGRIALSEQVTNPGSREHYLVNSLIEEAVTSSQLEGASTNRRVAKELIRSGREPRDRSERMILNNFYAMERVGELRQQKLTIDMICELHRIVTEGTLENPESAGRFQLPSETRVGIYDNENTLLYQPPPAEEIAKRMTQLCDFANETSSKTYLPGVLRALTIHFMIGYIHPFEDGNGRTARILFYWSMLNQGYWLTEFLSVSSLLKKAPGKYGRSFLHTETDDGDLTYFFIYHLGIIHRCITNLDAYLARKVEEAREVKDLLAAQATQFNSRQIAIIQNSVKNPRASYSVQSHMRSHRIAMETARKDLTELADAGLLKRERVGKQFQYTAVDDLTGKLKIVR